MMKHLAIAAAACALALVPLAAPPADAKVLLGEPEVDRASDQYDGLWCPAEQIQMYEGEFTADGPDVTLVFIATNHSEIDPDWWRRERIDNVTISTLDAYTTHRHLPDPDLADEYDCIEPAKTYFHFSDVPQNELIYLEQFHGGIPPGWDLSDGAYWVQGSSALNAFELPVSETGNALGLGLDEVPTTEATTEVTITGLTAGEQYAVSTWTGCIDASVGNDLLIQVYGTGFFSLVATPLPDPGPGLGCAFGDYDNDGDLDVYATHFNAESKLSRNDGAFFTDVTGAAGLTLNTPGTASQWVDGDNDGDLDLYVGSHGPNRYYRNMGFGTFENATLGPLGDTRHTESLDWGDYDLDGDLDCFLANIETDALLRNDGAAFVDVAAGALLGSGDPVGCSWVDADNDGDLDLFVTYSGQPNELLVNTAGTFVKSTPAVLATSGTNQAATWADYDDDGDLDVYMTVRVSGNKLYRNEGGLNFVDVTPPELASPGLCIEAIWGDWDNDGRLDLYLAKDGQPNVLFRNEGGGAFAVQSTGTVENTGVARSVAWGDYDEDGDIDLELVNLNGAGGGLPDALYRNEFGTRKNWLQVDLVGTISNRFGVGAKVYVSRAGVTRMREIGGESGLRSQNSLTADFGLGFAAGVEYVQVEWPSGIVQTVPGVLANQKITIVESGPTGAGEMAGEPHGSSMQNGAPAIQLLPNVPNPFSSSTTIRYELATPTDVELVIYDVAGRAVRTMERGMRAAGAHAVEWNGKDAGGEPVAAGIYFCELSSPGTRANRKILRLEER